MNIIVPMAGSGERFVMAGYSDPKPLIKVGGKRIIEYVCEMYDVDKDNFYFICNEEHLASTDMLSILDGIVSRPRIISMARHKLGPVYTVLAMRSLITDTEPVIVSYCDNPVKWDYDDFLCYVKRVNMDGCIVSHTGFHPHTLSSTMFAYSKTDVADRVYEVKEKACFTDNRFAEHASSGVYYFKYGSYVKKYFAEAISGNVNYNGEFYVTLVYNLLIKDGLSVYSYLNDEVLAFGTPNEVQNFEAWKTITGGGQARDNDDVLACYEYWRKYFSNEGHIA
jgi:NDP-sugar pyrophosphorylase family protein